MAQCAPPPKNMPLFVPKFDSIMYVNVSLYYDTLHQHI